MGTGGTVLAVGGSRPTGGSTAQTGGTTSSTGGSSAAQYIQIVNGYSTDAAHGIQGPWFTYADPLGTSVSPVCGTGNTCYGDVTGTEVCASGTALKVPCNTANVCDWTNYWGAAIGFNFNQSTEENAPAEFWDGSAYQGIAFHMQNSYVTTIRAYLKVLGDDTLSYCIDVTASGDYLIGWQQFRQDCWATGGAALPTSYYSQITGIGWQIAPSTIETINYAFCISNVRIY